MFFHKKNIFILFNDKSDKILFSKNGQINFFKIKINGNDYTNFVLSDVKANYNAKTFENKVNISRQELAHIIKNNNATNKLKYIIVLKKRQNYYFYFVDHIFRIIED